MNDKIEKVKEFVWDKSFKSFWILAGIFIIISILDLNWFTLMNILNYKDKAYYLIINQYQPRSSGI